MPFRRLPLAVVTGLLLALAAGSWWLFLHHPPTPDGDPHERSVLERLPDGRRPNIVLVTLDTVRADRLSCYGASRPETPHIDALAAEGVLFLDAATTVPFTLPAHSSMMTGAYPPRHGVRENVGYVLDERLPTLAEQLREAGWATAAFVSSFVLDSRWGIGRGFDTYFDDFVLAEGKPANLGSVQRDGAETVSRAIEWLDRPPRPAGSDEPVERQAAPERQPFFLWLHLFDAHDPYTPPEPFASRYPLHPYEAEVAYVDSLVGRFRTALEERDLLDSTWLVVTGDHGEGLGDHREGFHGFFVYDSTVRVPLVVRPPGGAASARTVDAAVSHVDLLPTVLAAAGLTPPADVDGRSLLPLLAGELPAWSGERAVYTESLYPLLHYGWAPLRAVRAGGMKYIEAPRPELYDLATDPGEQSNVLRRERQAAVALRRDLEALRAAFDSAAEAAPERAELDEETLAQLRALGYAAGRGGLSPEDEDAVARADPKDRIELHQLVMAAQSDLGSGETERAEERLRRALARDESILEAHEMLGRIASERGEFERAVEHYRRALAIDDELDAALFGLAHAYRQLGRDEDALVGFRRLAELDPDSGRASLAIVDLLLATDRRDEALAELERAAGRPEPGALVLNRYGEMLVEEERAEPAERAFRRAIAANEEFPPPYFNLAVLTEESGRLDEAIDLYEQAIERAPAHYQAQFNLGRLYGRRGDLDRQQELYEAAIESNPQFVRGYYYLAKLLLDRGGDLERAEQLVRSGLERDDEDRAGPLGYYLLADILNRLGRTGEAARAVAEGRRIEAGAAPGR